MALCSAMAVFAGSLGSMRALNAAPEVQPFRNCHQISEVPFHSLLRFVLSKLSMGHERQARIRQCTGPEPHARTGPSRVRAAHFAIGENTA